jgi:hypothetical protein
MYKEFIHYEQAVDLKELGFDEPCFAWYGPTGIFNDWESTDTIAPLYQQCFKWFREKYNLHSEILLDKTTQPKYCFEIHKYEDFGNYEEIRIGEWFLYRTYEEAELACLIKLIEILKTK